MSIAYVKVWTTLISNEQWQKTPAGARGLFLQMLLNCKNNRDDGYIFAAKMLQLSSLFALDVRTFRKYAAILGANGYLSLTESASGISINIHHYVEWQEATVKDVVTKRRKDAAKMPQNSGLLDYTKPDQLTLLQKKPEGASLDKSKQEESDIDGFVVAFHSECPTLPKVRDITEPRKRIILKMLKKQPDLQIWRGWFKDWINGSDYLSGRKTEWKASFDWILKPANYQKIKEGNYKNEEVSKVDFSRTAAGQTYAGVDNE